MFSSVNQSQNIGVAGNYSGSSVLSQGSLPVQNDRITLGGNSTDIGKDALMEKAKQLKAQLLAGKTTPSPYKGTAEEQLARNEKFMSGVSNSKGNTLNEIKEIADTKAEKYQTADAGLKLVADVGSVVATLAAVSAVGLCALGLFTGTMEAFHLAANTGASNSMMDSVGTAMKVLGGSGVVVGVSYGLSVISEKMGKIYTSFSGKLQEWKDHLAPKDQEAPNNYVSDYSI